MSSERRNFQWPDYLVFAAMLVGSLGIGVFYAFSGGKQKTQSEYLMGNRGMSIVPVAISILVSFMSAILILGTPAEIYQRGTMYFIYVIGMSLAIILATLLFVPLLYPLKFTSSYEYLEKRFNSRAAKLTGTLILFVMQILYMGIVLFSPSTALEAVTGFPTWATIIIGGVVSTVYTFLGGMKAVIWTDVFQAVIMAAGLLAVVIKGSIDVGGIGEVWRINYDGGRVEFWNFDPNPTVRHTFWTLVIGGTIGWLSTFGVNQASVQRYCSLPTLNKARISMMLNIPGVVFLLSITVLSGMVMYAYFTKLGCDPLRAGEATNPNQLMPLLVMRVLNVPGLPGLFLACLFSGSLSTMSSSLNALSAVTWEDLLKKKFHYLEESKKTLVTKLLVLGYGILGIAFAFAAQNLGGTVLQMSLSFTGAASGPLLGLFFLGGIFSFTNWLGAVIGGIIGLAFPMWISFGAYISRIHHPTLNTTIDNCTNYVNITMGEVNRTAPRTVQDMVGIEMLYIMWLLYRAGIEKLYTVSYLWYPAIGAFTVVVIGFFVSCFTGFDDPSETEGKYFLPYIERLIPCLPESTLKVLRCGTEEAVYDEEPPAHYETLNGSTGRLQESELEDIVKQKGGIDGPAVTELSGITPVIYRPITAEKGYVNGAINTAM